MYIPQILNLILVWPLCGLSSFGQSHRSVSAKMSALSQSEAQAEAESFVFV